MDHHSHAACAVFVRFSEVLRRTRKLHSGILEMFNYQHLPPLEGSCRKVDHPCNGRHVLNLVHRVRLQKWRQSRRWRVPDTQSLRLLALLVLQNPLSMTSTEIPCIHAPTPFPDHAGEIMRDYCKGGRH